jgi:hypothetical protein
VSYIQVFEGGPFAGVENLLDVRRSRFDRGRPRDIVVVSDAQLLEAALAWTVPYDIAQAPMLIIELGRLQHKNEIAPGVLWEVVAGRVGTLPTVLLLHKSPRLAWRASRDAKMLSLLENGVEGYEGATIEPYVGTSHIALVKLRDYMPRIQGDPFDPTQDYDDEYS